MIPKKIKIGGMVYTVIFDKTIQRDRGAYGEACGNTLQIRLDDNYPSHIKETTFVHELIEAMNFVYPLKLIHDQILLLETALYQVIKDNPGIFNFEENNVDNE